MVSILLTFIRLSSDNEISALKASGVSIYSLLPPVFLFSFFGFILTGLMTIYGLSWGKTALNKLSVEVISSHMDAGLKERTFIDSFKGLTIYINEIEPKSKIIRDIFIRDKNGSIITAPKGKFYNEPNNLSFHLTLYNGEVNQTSLEKKYINSIRFNTYNVNLNLKKSFSTPKDSIRNEKEMSVGELYSFLKTNKEKEPKYYKALIELHKKFSIPFACFALGLLAVPLGIQSPFAKRSFNLGFGLIFFLLYYILLSAGIVFGETGKYPPLIGMWLPNIVIGIIGVYFLKQVGKN
jgi:lipopolysaccharide export system permease protein